jgi:2-phosphosulfolactate phosphatase
MLVIVDTLSFSSAVVTAVAGGGLIYPCALNEDAAAVAAELGGEVAVPRRQVPFFRRFSLSPLTYLNLVAGTKVVLASPNGATCSQYEREVPYLFVGTLLNAAALASTLNHLLETTDLNLTIIACGERWEVSSTSASAAGAVFGEEDSGVRFAIEDYLGAGALLSYLHCEKSPEARVCEAAFHSVQGELAELLWNCESGRELREKNYGSDVKHAARLNLYQAVPVMRQGWLEQL